VLTEYAALRYAVTLRYFILPLVALVGIGPTNRDTRLQQSPAVIEICSAEFNDEGGKTRYIQWRIEGAGQRVGTRFLHVLGSAIAVKDGGRLPILEEEFGTIDEKQFRDLWRRLLSFQPHTFPSSPLPPSAPQFRVVSSFVTLRSMQGQEIRFAYPWSPASPRSNSDSIDPRVRSFLEVLWRSRGLATDPESDAPSRPSFSGFCFGDAQPHANTLLGEAWLARHQPKRR
jgi:hypothetical protein